MYRQILFGVEHFPTHFAAVRSLPFMDHQVDLKAVLTPEGFAAQITDVIVASSFVKLSKTVVVV